MAAPIGLFVWYNLQLLPVCIQLDQNPATFPMCGPNSGLIWQAAKVYFQVAAAHVHTLGAHEYCMYLTMLLFRYSYYLAQHVTIGAISMATPRQLSSVHPICIFSCSTLPN